MEFNRLIFLSRRTGNVTKVHREIIHYAAQAYGLNFNDDFNRLWFSYYCRTPFFSDKDFMNALNASRNKTNKAMWLWRKITNLSATRRRGFFMYPEDSEMVVELIGKNDGDIGFNASFPNAIDNLILAMEKNQNEMMFFINLKTNEYLKTRDVLLKHGFKKDLDFFNVKELMVSANDTVKEL